jgi:hypothetical protein
MTTSPSLFSHKGKVYEASEDPFFYQLKEVKLIPAKKTYEWKGAKIPFAFWQNAVNFLLWTQDKYKSESVVTFFYNTVENKWAFHAFPQSGIGMTVSRVKNEEAKKQRENWDEDWVEFGSIHHHCNAAAFQSGTDKNDEHDREGVHITLGNLESKVLDFDGRLILENDSHKFNCPSEWVELPHDFKLELPGLSDEAVDEILSSIFTDYLLQTCYYDRKSFPEQWQKNYTHKKETYTYKSKPHKGTQQTFPYEKKTTHVPDSGTGSTTRDQGAGTATEEEEVLAQGVFEREQLIIELHACIQATCHQFGVFSSDLLNNWDNRYLSEREIETPFPDDAHNILNALGFLEEQLELLPYEADADDLMTYILFE